MRVIYWQVGAVLPTIVSSRKPMPQKSDHVQTPGISNQPLRIEITNETVDSGLKKNRSKRRLARRDLGYVFLIQKAPNNLKLADALRLAPFVELVP